ncbi:pentapeptide repeat-containing protein [Paenibacillus sp. D2_2]|uniref:pentapeptide repeat-containing protein n=1 Tax=Paenibacillus sp. D2_2 TaxID=3073092 RepID=UPI002815B608|nr:pentapeptide repeat-containing protein [Paenibacillus sp. D2_2]WMT39858.1 pentapeptide repeat-containing protein [Paenibacillus sp. D2_2]
MNIKLQSDCEQCFGLCCVALPYAKSADFAFSKADGVPCRNLGPDHRCSIHKHLREKGFRGCVTYECFGAGQHVSQEIFKGRDWKVNPELSKEMYGVFPVVQQLHEMLYYLDQALDLEETRHIKTELQRIYDMTLSLAKLDTEDILLLDVPAHREMVNPLLLKTSELVRKEFAQRGKTSMLHLDLIGANLQSANLQGMNLRGVLLIASNLKNADLRKADFIGADLRDADLSDADLTDCIFLTQAQVNSAKGNKDTRLPRYLKAPDHWIT